jgi:chaperonin cofactor prefoldin
MPVFNPNSQILLEQLQTMSTDIRTQKQKIEQAIALGQAAQNAADAAASAVQVVSGTVQTISAEMVRKFTSQPIQSAAFVLDEVSGYFYATVSHLLGDAAPDVEVYDSDKDKQQIQSIIVDSNTIKLELSAADMASNSFPLTCIVLGKNTPTTSPVNPGEAIPGTTFIARFQASNNSVEYDAGSGYTQIAGTDGSLEAFIGADSWIYIQRPNDEYFKVLPGMWALSPTDGGNYANNKADVAAILLGAA